MVTISYRRVALFLVFCGNIRPQAGFPTADRSLVDFSDPGSYLRPCGVTTCDMRFQFCDSDMGACDSCVDMCSPQRMGSQEVAVQRCHDNCEAHLAFMSLGSTNREVVPPTPADPAGTPRDSSHEPFFGSSADVFLLCLDIILIVAVIAIAVAVLHLYRQQQKPQRKLYAGVAEETPKPGNARFSSHQNNIPPRSSHHCAADAHRISHSQQSRPLSDSRHSSQPGSSGPNTNVTQASTMPTRMRVPDTAKPRANHSHGHRGRDVASSEHLMRDSVEHQLETPGEHGPVSRMVANGSFQGSGVFPEDNSDGRQRTWGVHPEAEESKSAESPQADAETLLKVVNSQSSAAAAAAAAAPPPAAHNEARSHESQPEMRSGIHMNKNQSLETDRDDSSGIGTAGLAFHAYGDEERFGATSPLMHEERAY